MPPGTVRPQARGLAHRALKIRVSLRGKKSQRAIGACSVLTESKLLLRLDALSLQLLDLLRKNSFGRGRAVNAVCLDGNDDAAANLEEHVRVQSDNTSLVGLGNVGEDAVDHGNQHAVPERVTGVINNRDDVRTVLGHVHQIATATVTELNGVDVSSRADNISDVGDGRSGGSTQIQDLQEPC